MAPLSDDDEVEAVAAYLRSCGTPSYIGCIADQMVDAVAGSHSSAHSRAPADDLFDQAREVVLRDRKASTSYLQRRLSIGYNRAADLIDRLEDEGIVSPQNSSGRARSA